MVASYETIEAIAKAVRRHVDEETYLKILDDLASVPGNKSFRNTVQRLYELANRRVK